MLSKFSACYIIFMICLNTVFAQTAYHIKYNFNDDDKTDYSALLIRYNNGSSELRIKFNEPSGTTTIAKTEVEEYYGTDTAGNENTDVLIITAQHPKTLTGNPVNISTLPVFIFKMDEATGFHEPAGLAISDQNTDRNVLAVFSSEFVSSIWRNRNITISYFDKKADGQLYENFFGPGTRGSLPMKLNTNEKNINMHLVLVADTLDKTIGRACKLDLNRAYESFDTIRKYIGIADKNFIVKKIQGKSLSKQSVIDTIKSLKVRPADIVVFYYSGHGFRTNKRDSFPYMFLKINPKDSIEAVKGALKIDSVFERIRKKGGRCNLVLSDCCNVNLESRKDTSRAPGIRGDKWEFFENNIRTLFLSKERISVLGSAARNGEYSWCDKKTGGYFSTCFKSTLQDYTSKAKTKVNWPELMKELRQVSYDFVSRKCCECCKKECPRVACTQTPLFKIVKGR